jgi:hypothetical protein
MLVLPIRIDRQRSDMPFRVFDKRAAVATKNPMVTIQKQGSFSLNKAAHDLMGSPETVELLFDPEERLVGFRPVPATNPRAYPVRPQGKNAATFMIAGRAFAKHYELDTDIARRYSVEKQDDILVIDLKSDSIVVTGPRAAAKSRTGES